MGRAQMRRMSEKKKDAGSAAEVISPQSQRLKHLELISYLKYLAAHLTNEMLCLIIEIQIRLGWARTMDIT